MADSHVLHALKEKRARLAGELQATKLRAIALQVELGSVDNCLRIFRCDIDPKTIPAKISNGKSPYGLPKGAPIRTALEILRETNGAYTAQELAACVLQRYDRPLTAHALKLMVGAIHGNFARRKDGIVEFDRGSYPGKWRLTAR